MYAHRSRLAANLAALATASVVQAQTRVLYVDDDAPSGGDGSSWELAFSDLQDAIDEIAFLGNPLLNEEVELHIAQGVYHPDRGTLDRSRSFEFVAGAVSGLTLRVLGGFAGVLADRPDDRDPAAYVTTLSGDLLDNDYPGQPIRPDNSEQVLRTAVGSAVFDGLEINGAQSYGHSGAFLLGVLEDRVGEDAVVVRNCVISDNNNFGGGSAMYIDGSYPSSPHIRIEACSFIGNTRYSTDWSAAGAVQVQEGVVRFDRCRFIANNSFSDGGAVWASASGHPTFVGCLFAHNSASRTGGAIFAYSYTNKPPLLIDRCTFYGNYAPRGAAVSLPYAKIRNSILHDGAVSGFSLSLVNVFQMGPNDVVSVERCDVERGISNFSGRLDRVAWLEGNIDADPRFDATFRLMPGSPCIDRGQPIAPVEGEVDLAGLARFHDGDADGVARLDLGAFEFQPAACPSDIDHSGFVDTEDFDAFIRAFEAGC